MNKTKVALVACSVAIVLVLGLLIGLFVYADQHNKNSQYDKNTTEKTESEIKAEVVDDKDTQDTEVPTTTEQEKETEEEITEAEQTTDIAKVDIVEGEQELNEAWQKAFNIYERVLCDYITIIFEKYSYGDVRSMDYPYASECGHYGYCIFASDRGGIMDDVYYLIDDLDGDGAFELIIGNDQDGFVWDMYRIENGNPVRVLCSDARWSTYYCGSYFLEEGSSGATEQSHCKYEIRNSKAQLIEKVYSTSLMNDLSGVYFLYSTEENTNPENDVLLSANDYKAYIEAWENGRSQISNMVPLTEYWDSINTD